MVKLMENNTIYDRIRSRFSRQYGENITDTRIAELLGVSNHLVGKWKKGISRPSYEVLEKISELTNAQIDYLVTGYSYDITNGKLNRDTYQYFPVHNNMQPIKNEVDAYDIIPPNLIKGTVWNPSFWPVRGRAAADESNGTRVPDTDEFDDSIQPPEGLTAVPVIGNSMSPVILDGQYVLIDKDREGFEVDGGIVVASIREPDADDERAEPMTGTFVKRCYGAVDGIYYFTSINEYSPFSAWRDLCRVWPVIGVWFAGKGKPPTEG